jgi:hypothetical protein
MPSLTAGGRYRKLPKSGNSAGSSYGDLTFVSEPGHSFGGLLPVDFSPTRELKSLATVQVTAKCVQQAQNSIHVFNECILASQTWEKIARFYLALHQSMQYL